ncbi:MAG: hypothetical protein ABW161_01195 [Candidatus Thiodiazotropha sp.]
MIQRTPRLVKGALKQLDGGQLRRLKVRRVAGENAVLIKDDRGDQVLGFMSVLMTD